MNVRTVVMANFCKRLTLASSKKSISSGWNWRNCMFEGNLNFKFRHEKLAKNCKMSGLLQEDARVRLHRVPVWWSLTYLPTTSIPTSRIANEQSGGGISNGVREKKIIIANSFIRPNAKGSVNIADKIWGPSWPKKRQQQIRSFKVKREQPDRSGSSDQPPQVVRPRSHIFL